MSPRSFGLSGSWRPRLRASRAPPSEPRRLSPGVGGYPLVSKGLTLDHVQRDRAWLAATAFEVKNGYPQGCQRLQNFRVEVDGIPVLTGHLHFKGIQTPRTGKVYVGKVHAGDADGLSVRPLKQLPLPSRTNTDLLTFLPLPGQAREVELTNLNLTFRIVRHDDEAETTSDPWVGKLDGFRNMRVKGSRVLSKPSKSPTMPGHLRPQVRSTQRRVQTPVIFLGHAMRDRSIITNELATDVEATRWPAGCVCPLALLRLRTQRDWEEFEDPPAVS